MEGEYKIDTRQCSEGVPPGHGTADALPRGLKIHKKSSRENLGSLDMMKYCSFVADAAVNVRGWFPLRNRCGPVWEEGGQPRQRGSQFLSL